MDRLGMREAPRRRKDCTPAPDAPSSAIYEEWRRGGAVPTVHPDQLTVDDVLGELHGPHDTATQEGSGESKAA